MMTNFDKMKNTTLGDLFRTLNGNELTSSVFADFMYRWTNCEHCPCYEDCRNGFNDCRSIKINSPATCQSRLYKWLASNTQDTLQGVEVKNI